MAQNISNNLNIDSKTVEEIFSWYIDGNLIVNRRYQRKLVWSINEKRSLISSILEDYPIPLLLFVRAHDKREILDGMQRLEAVMSFISQQYDYNGHYFDLDSTAQTKLLKDTGKILQKGPILSREESSKLARYRFAISEYSSSSKNIDEVFRRINSNGKTLSRQELRSAGCVSNFSELVRKLSIQIRGDTSHSDILNLNSMAKISISSDQLNYGVSIENHFYVKNRVLTRVNIRESADEELVAHMLGYISLSEKPASASKSLDNFYGVNDTSQAISQREEIEAYIQTVGEEQIINNYLHVFNTICELFEKNQTTFNSHILGSGGSSNECPRYYQSIFLSFYELLINQNKEINDEEALFDKLKDMGASKIISIPKGDSWTAKSRQMTIEDVVAHITRFFKDSHQATRNKAWVNEINNIITSSATEQSNYDFKQGLLRLDGTFDFDDECLKSILKTCVGINNLGKEQSGHILIGIADCEKDAKRVRKLYCVDSIRNNEYHIMGIDHEASKTTGGLDGYFTKLKQKISNNYDIEPVDLKQQILKDIKICRYSDKKHIIKIDIKSVDQISSLDGEYYIRQGSSTEHIPKDNTASLGALFRNYFSGR
ncbi:DUF262 domain-containing protein [Aeromonas jandaei]|uniref:DUF262 domain-containing protein n=1 Tax=Aeromonas jandaei TaxID=650 RepID=UPI00227A0D40|nr:DUF262 domain-containing protein [Aeromonas jandaei]WAG06223.1 DUF262 domain-containing protein [Aeromonas jandaei]